MRTGAQTFQPSLSVLGEGRVWPPSFCFASQPGSGRLTPSGGCELQMTKHRRRRWRWLIPMLALALGSSTAAATIAPPPGGTAQCRDGTYSYLQHHSGTCSHHGGVAVWLDGSTSTSTKPSSSGTSDVGETVLLKARTQTSGCVLGLNPDRRCSPGAYYSKLTKRGHLLPVASARATIRNVTQSMKSAVEREYGLKPKSYGSTLEIDHIVSLELGGSNDIANLYPEEAKFSNGASRLPRQGQAREQAPRPRLRRADDAADGAAADRVELAEAVLEGLRREALSRSKKDRLRSSSRRRERLQATDSAHSVVLKNTGTASSMLTTGVISKSKNAVKGATISSATEASSASKSAIPPLPSARV